ncbi:MAG: glycosyltransferase family 2 protein [Chloroflexi bacterium]|nr:glycosyltransferase family 2 protein [Chloroflexota bacterium]
MLDISVVIVSFNTRDLLLQCLRSVFDGSASLGMEVWVVDNASTDGSAQAVRELCPEVRLIPNDQNQGFAAASNQAMRQCSGRYVLLLNPDTIVLEDALRRLVDFLDEHPRVGIAGGRLVYPDGSFQHSAFHFPTLAMALLDFFPINHRLINSRLNGRYPAGAYDRPFPIDHPLGANLLARREVLEQVGLLDENFFMYCEEIDFCLRTKLRGWDIYCVPSAKIVHYSGQSTRQFHAQMLIELYRSRYRLFRKHYGLLYNAGARAIIRLGVLREVVRSRLQARRREITNQELSERTSAYWEIFRM